MAASRAVLGFIPTNSSLHISKPTLGQTLVCKQRLSQHGSSVRRVRSELYMQEDKKSVTSNDSPKPTPIKANRMNINLEQTLMFLGYLGFPFVAINEIHLFQSGCNIKPTLFYGLVEGAGFLLLMSIIALSFSTTQSMRRQDANYLPGIPLLFFVIAFLGEYTYLYWTAGLAGQSCSVM
mmetsp:Transcript_11607/g.19893  ORF Transcript_11607/g.19893 Transcript_11607/m.19893 type:complete len:179 (+) Transcript_11607:1918-2454(+)